MTAYSYRDVLIVPAYSEVTSRSNVDLSTQLGPIKLNLPIISANMKTITGYKMAIAMYNSGGLSILHRFYSIEQAVDEYKKCNHINVGVSIGVKEDDKKRFDKLYEAGARLFCIDVAHGHHVLVKNMIKWIKNQEFLFTRDVKDRPIIIAGNIATADAAFDLTEWGADIIKCGLGNGKQCSTRRQTGVGYPQLTALENIAEQLNNQRVKPGIIADGGITCVGDIAKSLKFADTVMIGSFISGTSETPGNVFKNEKGQFYKVYSGSASGENKNDNSFVEGMTSEVLFKGHVRYILDEIKNGLSSSFSYVGANNLAEFKQRCKFVQISEGAMIESKF